MSSGPTPGLYANREGRYEVLPDGRVFVIGGAALPNGADPVEMEADRAGRRRTAKRRRKNKFIVSGRSERDRG